MSNVLCQIRGEKRVIIFPPSDVLHLGLYFTPFFISILAALGLLDCLVLDTKGDTDPCGMDFECSTGPGLLGLSPPFMPKSIALGSYSSKKS